MSFHGFDTARIRTMAATMKSIAPGARNLHGDLSHLLLDAQGLLDGKPATTSPLLEPLLGQVFPMFYTGLPASLHGELDDTSASMSRRCAQLDSVQKLEEQGYPVDPGLYFDDEPAPDQKKISDALAFFDDHIDDSGGFLWSNSAQGSREVLDKFATLTPAELDAVMSHMSDNQLKALNSQLGEGSSWWGAGDSDGSVKARWVNMLMSELGPTTLARVEPELTNLRWQPDPKTNDVKDATYKPVDGPLFGPDGPDIKHDLNQGDDGDCWFLASLAAVTQKDPNFPQQHIKQNPNGTYTVTFYRSPVFPQTEPQPVEVTVDNNFPVDKDGHLVYAHNPDGVMWIAVYEKAYAQYAGGYGKIEGGYGDEGMHDLTGAPTQRKSPLFVPLAVLDQQLKSGHAATVGTKGDVDLKHDHLISGHEYTVERVDMNAHPPTITVLNPWGSNSTENGEAVPQEVTMTQEEYLDNFDEVSTTRTGV